MSFDPIALNPYRAGFRAGLAAAFLVAATAAGIAYFSRAANAPPAAAPATVERERPIAGARIPTHSGFVGLPSRPVDRVEEPE